MYLTSVDGTYVFDKADLAKFDDGKVRCLYFSDKPNRVNRKERVAVCYKPEYKTLKRIQVRTGPGSKFGEAGILSAQEKVVVIQEGLLSCDLETVERWMFLHL